MVKTFYTNIRLKTGKLDVVQRMKCQHFYDSDLRVYTLNLFWALLLDFKRESNECLTYKM